MNKLDLAVIIAAGRGDRLRPLTDKIPKPLIEIGGRSLVYRVASRIQASGINHIYYSLGYMWEAVLDHIQSEPLLRQCFGGCFIDSSMPGTAYWIYNPILARCDLPVLVSTSDNIMEIDFDAVQRDYEELGRPTCLMIPVWSDGYAGTKIEYDESSRRVCRVIEGNRHQDCLIGSGLQIINPRKIVSLSSAPRMSFQDVWADLVRQDQLYVSKVLPARWVAVDNLQGLLLARAEFDRVPEESDGKAPPALARRQSF